MDSGKVLLGLLAGVAAGALLGVLFAPDKGSVTRTKITKKGEDYVDSLKEKFNELIEDLSEKFDKVKDNVRDHNGRVHGNSEDAVREVKTVTTPNP